MYSIMALQTTNIKEMCRIYVSRAVLCAYCGNQPAAKEIEDSSI
jgi:hypothetical protein